MAEEATQRRDRTASILPRAPAFCTTRSQGHAQERHCAPYSPTPLPWPSLWYGKKERRSLAGFRLDPDTPTMALDNFLAQGQADAGARVAIPRVQTLKDDKNPLSVLWCYADAVIAH